MIDVRPFVAGDAVAVGEMLVEMASGYGATIDPGLDVPADVVRRSRDTDFLVAARGEELCGFATFTSLYPVAGLLAFTYIQQLYVSLSARRLGVAALLMKGIARISRERGMTKMEWSTSVDNAGARALYEGLGAKGVKKMQYALDGPALRALAR
ncbi:MAG: GNAT family N-acetyltransferase [Alphaproteobacteria bacterium]|nr:GNAT family N-acetyltransferase [Alphaproteobacteria bacterium]